MRARLPQTNKEEYKKRQQRKTKKISAGKRKPTAADGRLGERERERERERKRKSQSQKRGRGERKNKRKCQFSSGKMGFTEQKLQQ
jgi:hypothetical protein